MKCSQDTEGSDQLLWAAEQDKPDKDINIWARIKKKAKILDLKEETILCKGKQLSS